MAELLPSLPDTASPRVRRRADRQQGQIVVIFALMLVVLMGFGALVVDVGVLRRANQELWSALDAGALAGASQLPANGANATTLATKFARDNYPGLPASDIAVTYRCLVGDRDNNGVPDTMDIPTVCDPGGNVAGLWVCANGICVAPCVPSEGDTCNTIVVTSVATVPFRFGPAVGVTNGKTQIVTSAACKGPCGAAPTIPLDLVIVIDRTGSMSAADMINAKDAAKSVLTFLNPDTEHVALGLLGPSNTGTTCTGANSPAKGVGATAAQYGSTYPSDLTKWIPVGLTGIGAPVNESYLTGTAVNPNSLIVKTIECMSASSTGTNLSTPIKMARQYLAASGRSGVKKAILFETDGSPNYTSAGTASDFTCLAANNEATTAKTSGGIEIFTVGFGIDATDLCPDTSGTYNGKTVTRVLADMATLSTDGGCVAAENTDGDNFFCQPRSQDLQSVFMTAVSQLTASTRLVHLPGT